MTLQDPIVRVSGLHKYFGMNHVLRGLDLDVMRGEAVMVIGRSGSGKTTLLRCINFLEEPTAGSIEVDGLRVNAEPLRSRDRSIGSRFARYACVRACSSRSSTCSRT